MTTTIETGTSSSEEAAVGAIVERLFGAALGAAELLTVCLGLKLDLYRALDHGPAAPPQLASRAGINPRYAREWLEQQTVSGLVAVDDPSAGDDDRVYRLLPATAAVLLDDDSEAAMAPLALLVPALARALDAVAHAYRTGTGLTFADYGDDLRHGQGGFNRPGFLAHLASEWVAAMPDIAARLGGAGARVADIGCGVGWSSIALARAFPGAWIDGFDTDEASIADARRHASDAGVDDRVRFEIQDAAHLAGSGYHLICVLEALHDMSRPVEVLAAARAALAPGGAVLVMDEGVADSFTVDAGEVERLIYAGSVLHCLPVGMAEQPSAATGAVIRPATVRRYAEQAGYRSCEPLPIQHDFFRFYRLEAPMG